MLGHSPSNLSSPLSEVEDRDADADEMDFDLPSPRATSLARQPQLEDLEVSSPSLSTGTDDGEESRLSEPDVNDSEAETERPYDTPPKNTVGRDIIYRATESGGAQHFLERRSRAFEPSPSKLQRQIRAQTDGEDDGSDNDSLSDVDDDVSMASNDREQDAEKVDDSRSPSPVRKVSKVSQNTTEDSAPTPHGTKEEAIDTRKRKRSSAAEQLEVEQPLRKRTGSVGVPEREFSADDVAIVDDEAATPTLQSGEHTADEEDADQKSKDVPTQSIEDTPQHSRSKSAKRSTAKRRKGRDDGGGAHGNNESALEDGETPTAEDDGAGNAEDEQPEANADEEAEIAHKNEEERTYTSAQSL
jgi:hypothetical protein